MFRTEKLILEGPDLSGKTSLYSEIHKQTNFKWNIQDRSALSMICYARQFNRDDTQLRRDFYKEVTNLNNRFVILIPSFEIIEKRYNLRGDNVQDRSSLKDLYSIFESEVEIIKNLPNVFVVKSEDSTLSIASAVITWANLLERSDSRFAGEIIRRFVEEAEGNEHTLQLEFSGKINKNYDKTILLNSLEGSYYQKITKDFCDIIEAEFEGLNEYNIPQDMNSRRFYYSSRSCISSLHLKPRNSMLELICTFRSTDAQKNASIDFEFLNYLVHKTANEYFLNCNDYRIILSMNSAHLR